MRTTLITVTTLITLVNGQLPGLPDFGRTVGRARNLGRRIQDPPSDTRVQVQASATPGRGRVILTQRNHPNIEQRLPIAQEEALENEWRDFKILYNKSYPTPEIDFLRKQNFFTNREAITKFNQDYAFGLSSYILKLNQFGDLLVGEFNQLLNGFRGGNRKDRDSSFQPATYIPPINTNLPKSINWKELGGVSPVKFQGLCGSCHAFSAVGAIEGHNYRKTGVLVELSAQNLVDCPPKQSYQTFGCAGGHVDEDFKYIWQNPGIDREDAYTYEAMDGQCRFSPNVVGANITGYVEIPEGDERCLETAVATLGPVSIGIDASQMTFQFYSQGIYYDENCKNRGENINHAMLIVGFGEEPDGHQYWLVKNSYGPQWGMGGYIKIAKNRNNHCGIATSAVYPLV